MDEDRQMGRVPGLLGVQGLVMQWLAHKYQDEDVRLMLKHPALALLNEPGLGKTVIALTAIEAFKRAGIGPALVLAPLRVCHEVWRQEAQKWDHLHGLKVQLLHAEKGANLLGWRNTGARERADVFLLNYEGLSWLDEQGWRFFAKKPEVLILDESTAIKSHRSQRFQFLRKFLPLFKRRYLLSGTPAPNGLLDLWSQYYALDGGKTLEPFFGQYRRKYFFPTGYGGYKWELQKDAEPRIHAKIRPISSHRRSVDYLEMPELVTVPLWVTLPPEAQQIYQDLEDEMMAELKSGTLTVANAAVLISKLRQVTSGSVYDDSLRANFIHDQKYEAVAEFVEGLAGQGALVVFEYKHEKVQLQKRLKGWPALDGESSPKMTRQLIQNWNAGLLPGLLVHPQACGHGLNLQHGPGRHLLWTSGTWSLELAIQMVGRLWRQGQKQTVIVSRLMARDTIDPILWKRVDQKDDAQDTLLDFLKAELQ